MDRLIIALDALLEDGGIVDDVVVTAAAYGAWPKRANGLGIRPYDELVELIRGARAVITHGGPASIFMAISAGHIPVVVPRDPSFQEHVDGHQLRFAAWLADRCPIDVVTEMNQLGPAVRKRLASGADRRPEPSVPVEAIERLRAILSRRE